MTGAKRLALCILSVLPFLSGCAANHALTKQPLLDDGELYVYVQPFPQEAERLAFTLEQVSAVRQDGSEVPLTLTLNAFKPAEMRRQRIMATGILPPGMYRGLSFKAGKAVLKTEEGEADLLTAKKAITAEFPFTVTKKQASTLQVKFLAEKSIAGGFSFSPLFSLYQPGNPVAGLIGYVSNNGADTITVFDKKTGQVVSVLATGRGPKGLAFDKLRNRAYVALSGEDAIGAIDINTGDLLSTIRLHDGAGPRDLALTPDGRLLVSVNPGSNSVSLIDPLSYLELNRIPVGEDPSTVLMEPGAARRAYVFNILSNTISVVDTATAAVAGPVRTETGPVRGQFNRKGDRIYVVYERSPHLTVVDPASLQVSAQTFIRMPAGAMKVDTMTDMIYIAGTQRSGVEIYEPLSLMPVDYIGAGDGVSYLTIDGQENSLLLLSPGTRTLTSVNINTRSTVFVLDVGEDPYQVALMGER